MASIRFRNNKWQARVSHKGEQSPVKIFTNIFKGDGWALQVQMHLMPLG